MITLNEIKEMHIGWIKDKSTVALTMNDVFFVLRDLAERIEKMEAMEAVEPPKVAWTGDVGSGRITSIGGQVVADIERATMIKALRWACNGCSDTHDGCPANGAECHIQNAWTRLENGGEL